MRQNLRTRPTLLGAALVGAALGVAPPSAAANILNNGTFGSGLGGWAATPSVEWAPEGAAGPGSGSARIRGNPGIVGALMLSQCAAVTPGTDYDLGATTLLPYSPEAEGGVSLRVVWHSWPGCEGATLGLSPALDFPPVAPADWTRRGLERLRAPSGAASASVLIVPWASGPELAFAAFVDDVELSPSNRFVTLTVPTAASVDGAGGERFRTTLVLTNPAPFTRRIDVRLRCHADQPCSTAAVSLVFAPRETRVFADALLEIFGKPSGAGALEVTYEATPGPIVASARAAPRAPARPESRSRIDRKEATRCSSASPSRATGSTTSRLPPVCRSGPVTPVVFPFASSGTLSRAARGRPCAAPRRSTSPSPSPPGGR